jgi:phage regulator Rha-like protein
MAKNKSEIMIPDEMIMNKIYLIRGKKVMLDRDLAELYEIETKQLKRAVRRKISRFPKDFMFELTTGEFKNLRSQFGTSSWGGSRYLSMAFTEHGVIMLASVLNSERAVQMNIRIVRIFTRMREILASHKGVLQKLEKIEQILAEHDDQILVIFKYLKQLERSKKQELDYQNRKRVGFKRKDE